MPDQEQAQTQAAPPPPPGFSPVEQAPTPPPGFSPVRREEDYASEVRDYWQRRRQQEPDLTLEAAERQYKSTIGKGGPAPKPVTALGKVAAPVAEVLGGVAAGAGKGVAETVKGGAELLGMGAEAVGLPPGTVPVPFRGEDLEARGPAESVGKFGEAVGEFAAGEEVLKGIQALVKTPEAVLKLMEMYPRAAKIITGMAKGATLGGAQAGVKAPEGEKLEAAKAGAVGGGIGGAATEVAGMVAKPVLKTAGLATTAEEDIARAARPGKRNYRFIQDWALAKPRLAAEIEEGGTFGSMQDAADRIADVRRKVWSEDVVPAVTRHADEALDTRPIVRAIRERITPQMQLHAPEQAKAVEDIANRFVSARKVGDVEKELEFLNAQLTEAGWWRKLPQERAAAVKANGVLSGTDAAVTSMRDALYDHLEAAGEAGVQESKRLYGALRNVENEVRGQVNVAARQVPLSLKQVIGLAAGVAHGGPGGLVAAAIPFLDKLYNEPAALLTRAVRKGAPAGPVRAAAQDIAEGAGVLAKKAAPVAGERAAEGWTRIRASDGSIHDIPNENLDKARERDPGLQVQPQQ